MNGYIKRNAWIAVTLFGWTLMVSLAQAASFDCAKASTKVEKLICGDAALSKLDEELNTAYKTAVQDEKQTDTIKQAQKQWMKERNGCDDAGCVKRAYEVRLSSLKVTHTSPDVGVAAKPEAATTLAQAKAESPATVLPFVMKCWHTSNPVTKTQHRRPARKSGCRQMETGRGRNPES